MAAAATATKEWNLIEIARKRVLEDILEAARAAEQKSAQQQQQQSQQWFVLVVDGRTLRVVSSCMRMFDVMEENVSVVENVSKARQPLPALPAVYVLSPTADSVDALIRDWPAPPARAMYARAHVFFSAPLPEPLFKRLAHSTARPALRSLVELHMDFLAQEPRAFALDTPESFFRLYSPESPALNDECAAIAERLATLCVSLREYPVVRFEQLQQQQQQLQPVAKLIAGALQARLDDLVRRNVYSPDMACRAVLLVVGRTVDPVAPVLAEFTFQAMAHHLLADNVGASGGHYKFTYAGAQKEVVLDDFDTLWPTLRHMHVADVINWITENFNAFLRANKATAMAKGGAKSVTSFKEMREALRAMPQYTELLSKYSLHMSLASDCMEQFNARQMLRVASVEQDLATGRDASGAEAKNVMSVLPPILSDPAVNAEDKKRLIMLYIISQEGMKEQDRRRMMEYASLSATDQAAISNLFYLGVTLTKPLKGTAKKKTKKATRKRDEEGDVPYELSRFVPRMKSIFRDLIAGTLSQDEFPFIKESASSAAAQAQKSAAVERSGLKSASAQPRWATDSKGKAPAASGSGVDSPGAGRRADEVNAVADSHPRVIVFVAGGMTFSEMRTAYEVSKRDSRHCYIGSTHMLTPQLFIESLASLKKLV